MGCPTPSQESEAVRLQASGGGGDAFKRMIVRRVLSFVVVSVRITLLRARGNMRALHGGDQRFLPLVDRNLASFRSDYGGCAVT